MLKIPSRGALLIVCRCVLSIRVCFVVKSCGLFLAIGCTLVLQVGGLKFKLRTGCMHANPLRGAMFFLHRWVLNVLIWGVTKFLLYIDLEIFTKYVLGNIFWRAKVDLFRRNVLLEIGLNRCVPCHRYPILDVDLLDMLHILLCCVLHAHNLEVVMGIGLLLRAPCRPSVLAGALRSVLGVTMRGVITNLNFFRVVAFVLVPRYDGMFLTGSALTRYRSTNNRNRRSLHYSNRSLANKSTNNLFRIRSNNTNHLLLGLGCNLVLHDGLNVLMQCLFKCFKFVLRRALNLPVPIKPFAHGVPKWFVSRALNFLMDSWLDDFCITTMCDLFCRFGLNFRGAHVLNNFALGIACFSDLLRAVSNAKLFCCAAFSIVCHVLLVELSSSFPIIATGIVTLMVLDRPAPVLNVLPLPLRPVCLLYVVSITVALLAALPGTATIGSIIDLLDEFGHRSLLVWTVDIICNIMCTLLAGPAPRDCLFCGLGLR
mmetsp:Transcript_65725/g.213910  ORF Transcript_65725/g.213910 Transcript_65725/m.213910 type:complete len:484 (-) Transcript_65725:1683-3134(-)